MPALCWAMLVAGQPKSLSWMMGGMEMLWTVLHAVLACLEMGMMLAAVPLWCVLPGGMFATWMSACAGVVMVMCWLLNGREQLYQCNAGAEGWMMGQEAEDEKRMFVGGMGMSSRHCHRHTLPAMSRLFCRPMMCICRHTYGLHFDTVAVMLQRCLPMPSQARRNLSQMRCALLDDSMNRCVVLCHQDVSFIVCQAVTQLCANIPADKLGKLEVYTFGAAAYEFVMPLGDSGMESDQHSSEQQPGVHIEHFAMVNDPFAQMGVLHSLRHSMDSRFCGGVFVINADSSNTSNASQKKTSRHRAGLALDDNLMALFHTQMMMMTMPMPTSTTSTSTVTTTPHRRSVLDSVMAIDKDCAEKREIAAMSNYHAAAHAEKGSGSGGGKRLSWTGLATMAAATAGGGGQRNGMNAGMVALEMARKGCRNCDGHRGREVTWLARYVDMGGKQAGVGGGGDGRMSP